MMVCEHFHPNQRLQLRSDKPMRQNNFSSIDAKHDL
jgi:hypothetical protein